MHRRIRIGRREDGQALVEFALVAPLLIMVLFGIIDFGLALNQYNDTTNLANLGVRAAALASSTSTNPTCTTGASTSTSLNSYLTCEGATEGVTANGVCVDDTSGSSWAQGDTVQVTVDSVFNWMKLMFAGDGRLGGVVPALTTTIASSASMREEASGNTSIPSWVSTGAYTTTTSC